MVELGAAGDIELVAHDVDPTAATDRSDDLARSDAAARDVARVVAGLASGADEVVVSDIAAAIRAAVAIELVLQARPEFAVGDGPGGGVDQR